MPQSQYQVIGEALATSLNAASFAEPPQAFFQWVPSFEAEKLRKLTVPVIPSGYLKLKGLTRGGLGLHLYTIDLGVIQKVEPSQREKRIGELMGLVEEMVKHVQTVRQFASYILHSQTAEPLYDVEMMEQHGIFRQATHFQFRVCL